MMLILETGMVSELLIEVQTTRKGAREKMVVRNLVSTNFSRIRSTKSRLIANAFRDHDGSILKRGRSGITRGH